MTTTENRTETKGELPPGAAEMRTIIRLMTGAWVQQALYVVAKLGVPDLLVDGPRPVEDLAAEAGAHVESLYRFMRALASVDVFTEPRPRTFELTAIGEYLCSDKPGGHRWIVISHGEEAYQAFGESLYTATTGKPAFDKVFGKPIFDWLSERPERRAQLNRAAAASTDVPLVAASIDLTDVRRIVDVCGGQGRLVGTLLKRAPEATAVLFDLPEALRDAPPILAEYGVQDRVELVGGDVFESVPSGGDLYTNSRCLHDFDDVQVGQILANVRAAARPGARFAILDGFMPEMPGYNPVKIADLLMMTVHGGRFYTEAEMKALLDSAGFTHTGTVHVPPGSDPRAESLMMSIAH
jgi:O-methyltransferase domain/Dimerisation domain